MVHGLSVQSGGRFTLKSQVGEGTTAELWLPVAAGQARALDEVRRPVHDANAGNSRLVVVAVDDDGLVLTNTIAMLEDLGHVGLPASSGKEALDVLRRHGCVHLVITDQAMPEMTGLRLADAIKKEWPDLPVLLATGYAEIEPGSESDLPKLSKPFTEADLAEKIAEIVPSTPTGGHILKFRTGGTPKA